jgi:uncharacterized protein YjbJ (UPF0337 family)
MDSPRDSVAIDLYTERRPVMGAGTGDKAEGKLDELKGKVKEGVGDATGDRDLQAEGEVDQTKGKAKQAWGDVKNAGEKTKDAIKDAID